MNVAFYFKNKRNIVLDFNGATVFLHGMIQPFLLDECENVTIKNCIVEYDRSFVTEAEIINSTPDEMKIKIYEKFPYRVENGDLIVYGETWENRDLDKRPMFFQLFDGKTREGAGLLRAVVGRNAQIGDKPYDKAAYKLFAEKEDEYVILHGEKLPVIKAGLRLVIGHSDRKYSSVMILKSKNVLIKNYRILNGIGMGIVPMHSKDVVLDELKMFYDERSHGFSTNVADGVHAVACSGKFIIKNSIIEGTVDDALNIHGNFYKLVSSDKHTIKALSAGVVSVDYTVFKAGDTVRVYKGSTLEEYGDYEIAELIKTGENDVQMFFNEELPDFIIGSVIENISANPEVMINNCRFGKANTHLRFQSRGKTVVKNCRTSLPFWFTGDMNFWYESGPVCDMVVEDTEFISENAVVCCMPRFTPTKREPYYHKKISVKCCSFDSETPLTAEYTHTIEFIGNKNARGKSMKLILENCGECVSDCCEVKRISTDKNLLNDIN